MFQWFANFCHRELCRKKKKEEGIRIFILQGSSTSYKLEKQDKYANYIQLAQLCVTRWWSCVLGQYRTAIIGTWWHWVSIRQCQLILDGTGSDMACMPLYIEKSGCLVGQTWNLSEVLHDRIFGPKILLTKMRKLLLFSLAIKAQNFQ